LFSKPWTEESDALIEQVDVDDNKCRTGCIYLITCLITGLVYVGQTLNYKRRMKEHEYSGKKFAFNCDFDCFGWLLRLIVTILSTFFVSVLCVVLGLDMALRIIKSWVSGKLFSNNFQDNFRIWLSVEAVQIKKFRSALNLSTLGGTSFNQSYLNCILVSTKLDHSFYKKTCVLRRFSSIYNSQ